VTAVLRADELPDGAATTVEALGTTVALFNVGGRIYALDNGCAHDGGPLCHGRVTGTLTSPRPYEYRFDAGRPVVTCPWHGWQYDLETGRALFDRRVFVRRYDARVEDGEIVLHGPARGGG
jgi:nitrite reductase (NADH) small subunit